jgi:hypothetical protein
LDDCATLVLQRYPEVNAPIRTNGKGEEIFVNVIYGKQSLTDADRRPGGHDADRGRPSATHRSVEQSIACGSAISTRR